MSKLLSPDSRLQQCEINDSAHVKLGDTGDFVRRIQQALLRIEFPNIDASELESGGYGVSTAAAVLAYKEKRDIVNRTYQTKADDIVGKMTIKSLDAEMLGLEAGVSDEFIGASLRPTEGRLT
jgi:hypothetical protein